MATYTPNYNLSKPEPTDEYQDFLDSYGDNMDIIDNNLGGGGGGGGGHTIVDPTGTDMPQENKLQFTGSVNVSDDNVNGMTVVDIEGGGNYYLNTLYSTEEKKVGYYVDGKPLYQRTFDLGSDTNISNSSWQTSVFSISDLEKIIVIHGVNSSGTAYPLNAYHTGDNVNLLACRDGNPANVRWITAQYTKTTDTADPNPQTGGVIYLPTIYSEEEREVGVWTDGKPLYQKTIDCGVAPSQSQVKSVAHNISNIEFIVDFNGFGRRGSDGATLFIPNISRGNVNSQTSISVNTTNVNINNGSSSDLNANYNVYVTLQYTKTTDTAGSGSWNTDGVPTHHYSTNEQVIGTWVDGKPLYEKSFNLPSTITINNSSWTSTGVSISDIKNVVDGELNRNGLQKFACSLRAENSVIVIQTYFNGAQCNTDSVITVRYTKTTD